MPQSIRQALLDALALLMPVECAGCGRPDRALCESCVAQLDAHVTASALRDGTVIRSALRYEGVQRRVILGFKEQGRTDVARALSAPLAIALAAAAAEQHEIAAVPTSRGGFRRRGYDPVALLLARAGYRPARVLQSVRSTATQKLLDAESRAENKIGSLRPRGDLSGRKFTVVDDVVTTGATVIEAVRAIREGGGEVVSVVALASTPKLLRSL